MEWAFKQNF